MYVKHVLIPACKVCMSITRCIYINHRSDANHVSFADSIYMYLVWSGTAINSARHLRERGSRLGDPARDELIAPDKHLEGKHYLQREGGGREGGETGKTAKRQGEERERVRQRQANSDRVRERERDHLGPQRWLVQHVQKAHGGSQPGLVPTRQKCLSQMTAR